MCSVHQGVFSTSEDTMSTLGGYHEYIGGYHDACGGYHEYIGGCSVHWGDIMIHVGKQVGENLSISIENPNARCTAHPLMYS